MHGVAPIDGAVSRPDCPLWPASGDSSGPRVLCAVTRHDVRVPKALGDSLAALASKWRENAGGWSQYFDYSVESAVVVDNFIDLLLSTEEEISDLQHMGIGAYVGEVIRRSAGGEWVAMQEGPTP